MATETAFGVVYHNPRDIEHNWQHRKVRWKHGTDWPPKLGVRSRALLTPWFRASRLQSCEIVNCYCCLKTPILCSFFYSSSRISIWLYCELEFWRPVDTETYGEGILREEWWQSVTTIFLLSSLPKLSGTGEILNVHSANEPFFLLSPLHFYLACIFSTPLWVPEFHPFPFRVIIC